MHNRSLPGWRPHFASTSPLFAPLRHLAAAFERFDAWPALSDYQYLLEQWPEPLTTLAGKSLKVVAQAGRPGCFEEHYAPRIYATGEIQTRSENWHDFFQLLSWFMFPKTKALINSLHLPHAQRRIEAQQLGRRSPLENMLSLFDEGGAVIVAADISLLQLIRDFNWHELFWQRRAELENKLACITFGHAMYEKGLAPYLGMTANAILIECDAAFFTLDNQQQLRWLDEKLTAVFTSGTLQQPRDLQPFPILGLPGWDANNEDAAYYANTDYFRPGRRRTAA